LLSQFLLDSQITLPQIHIVTIQLSKLLTPLIKLEEEDAVAVVVVLAVVPADVHLDRQVALVKVNYIWITQAKTKVKQ
jgi:hypothetical protein